MAAVHNNDAFWGDPEILSALRMDNELGQQFFARFDFSTLISLSLVLVASGLLLACRKLIEAVVYLFFLPAMAITVTLPKLLIKRPRPEGALEGLTDSFPSGTAAASIMLLGFLIYLIGEFVPPGKVRIALQLAVASVVILLGVSRVIAGEHWPSDIIGGYMAGGLALFAIIWLYQKLRQRDQGLKA